MMKNSEYFPLGGCRPCNAAIDKRGTLQKSTGLCAHFSSHGIKQFRKHGTRSKRNGENGERTGGISRSLSPGDQDLSCIFNPMSQFIQLFVVFALNFAIFARRNNRFHPGLFRFFNDCVRIIAAISQKNLGCNAINQGFSLLAIR